MRIAVFIEASPELTGAFQQSLSTAEFLSRSTALSHEWVVFTPSRGALGKLKEHGIDAVLYRQGMFRVLDRLSATPLGGAILRRLRRLGLPRLGRHLDAVLADHRIDLVFLNQCADAGLRIGDHPFIVAAWDTDQHDHPEFPEAHAHRLFERTDWQMRPTLRRAVAVVANTSAGAQRLEKLFNVDRHRIVVFPFVPSAAVRRHAAGRGTVTVEQVRQAHRLPVPYVFYPASFLFHKNHLYLLEALVDLERRHGIVLSAVFSRGGGELDVRRQAQALGLRDRVAFVGMVPDDHMPPLYQAALALVVPSYFGPTNLPPVEAVALGCPVICADDAGNREQLGEAALYCRLEDPSSLADQLAALCRDAAAQERLRVAGQRLAERLAKVDYGAILAPVLADFAYKRRRWTWPSVQ